MEPTKSKSKFRRKTSPPSSESYSMPKKKPTCNKQSFPSRLFHTWLTLQTWTWKRYVPPKCPSTLNGLYFVTCQRLELFKTTSMRTSNPSNLFFASCYRQQSMFQLHTFNSSFPTSSSVYASFRFMPQNIFRHSVTRQIYGDYLWKFSRY
jgi:hypothetical protein